MSYNLGEKTFPLSRTSLDQVSATSYTNYGEDRDITSLIKNTQKSLRTVAEAIESLRQPHEENDELYEEEEVVDLTPQEVERRKNRSEIIDSSLSSLYSDYRKLVDLNAYNKILSESAAQSARAYKFPPKFDELNENNIDGMETDNLAVILDQKFQALVNSYNSKPQKERYGESASDYVNMRESIWKINHRKNMPNINMEYSDYSDDDEDLVVEETVQSFKCPLTKKYFESPLTSKVCGHSFSSTAILEVIRSSDDYRILCPVPACSHHFGEQDLERNPTLERETKIAKRRALREQERRDQGMERL